MSWDTGAGGNWEGDGSVSLNEPAGSAWNGGGPDGGAANGNSYGGDDSYGNANGGEGEGGGHHQGGCFNCGEEG